MTADTITQCTGLIIYCTLAFGIHGGEFITGINRQVRNVICAFPFALVAYFLWNYPEAVVAFVLAYIGVSLGFTKYPLWLKGMTTLFPFGALLLPLAYRIGYSTRWKNVLAEYLSGTFYGVALCILLLIKINL